MISGLDAPTTVAGLGAGRSCRSPCFGIGFLLSLTFALGYTVSMANTPSKPFVRIFPDFGNAPWAWGSSGVCVASASWWGLEGYGISEQLKKDFSDWAWEFEDNWEKFGTAEEREGLFKLTEASPEEIREDIEQWKAQPKFDWRSYHERGLALAKRLYDELGGAVQVIYEKPCEDPDWQVNEKTVFG